MASRDRDIVHWGTVRCAAGAAAVALALGAQLAIPAPASAQGRQDGRQDGRLDARYAVTLSGIPIGKGSWVIDIAENQFTAAASGATSGLLRVFASGQGSGASRGHIVGGAPVPASFAASITSDRKTEEIRMTLAAGGVKDYAITPPPNPDPERVPVTEAHRRGASDPMTASLYRVPGNGNPLGPQACQRVAPVFDGRLRYDLQFVYKRMDRVRAERGYEGPVVVCSVYFVPVAGHVPTRAAVKYLMNQRDMETWLAPVGSTRVVVPYRVSIPTPIGIGVMEATQFVSVSLPRPATGKLPTQ